MQLYPMRRGYVLGFTVLLVGAIAACSSPTPDSSSSATTQSASTDPTVIPATKVVALSSATSDLVETLAGDVLVGIAGSRLTATDPRFEGLPVVSQGRTEPDLEKIIALEPDLVIGAAGFHDKALQRLEELSVPTLAYDIDTWSELNAFTEDLALRLGVDAGVMSGSL